MIQTNPYDAGGAGYGPMGQNQKPWGLEHAVDTSAADAATQQSAAAQAIVQARRNRLLELAESAQGQRKQHYDIEAKELADLYARDPDGFDEAAAAKWGIIGTLAGGPVGPTIGAAAGIIGGKQDESANQKAYYDAQKALARKYGY
jgi:hypothetical protein